MAATSSEIRAQVHVPTSCAEQVTPVLAVAGLRPADGADVGLLVTDHDDPSPADPWSVDSLPHLVVRLGSESVRIGPFVQPGVTACLRCVEAGRPRAGPALAAYAALDPALLMVGIGWAARDLASWHAAVLPTTWSTTVTIGIDLQPRLKRWPRHPHCGCTWGMTAPGVR